MSVEIDMKKLLTSLNGIKAELENPKELVELAVLEQEASVGEAFETEISPTGKVWTNKPETTAKKEKAGKSKIGQWSGLLKNNIRKEVFSDTAKIENVTPYASYINDGTKHIEKKSFLEENEETNERIKTR